MIICTDICSYTCIYVMYIYVVFTAVFMGIGLNLTNKHLFWLLLYPFFVQIVNYAIHIKI